MIANRVTCLAPVVHLAFVAMAMTACASESTKAGSEASPMSASLDGYGFLVNGVSVTRATTMHELESIIGKADRSSLPDQAKVEETRAKWGFEPSNIYTYDSLGLKVYQNIGTRTFQSIVFDLRKGDNSFSPAAVYSGAISIAGVSLGASTSLQETRQIQGLVYKEMPAPVAHRVASYHGFGVNLDFDGRLETSELTSISIAFPTPPERTDVNGWTDAAKAALKAGFFNTSLSSNSRLREIVAKAGSDYDSFVTCYCDEVIHTIKYTDIEKLSLEVQQRMDTILQNCLAKTALRH